MSVLFPNLRRDGPGGEELSRIQDNVRRAFASLLGSTAILNGRLVLEQDLSIGTNTINHGLGRAPRGWIPVRVRAATTLSDTQDANTTPSRTLLITSTAVVTVDLWVF